MATVAVRRWRCLTLRNSAFESRSRTDTWPPFGIERVLKPSVSVRPRTLAVTLAEPVQPSVFSFGHDSRNR